MDEDDPVVQEIPVFLSQALAEHLYVFQYPIKPADRDWSQVKVTNAAIKPQNEIVKLEVALDTYSDKYCGSKGEQIALNTDGQQESSRYSKDKEKEKTVYFRNGIMDKVVYESTAPSVDTGYYAVAILQDKELHCTPVKGTVQLRPSYSYFDRQDKRKKDNDKAENSDEEEEPEAQQVTVKFARQETDVVKKAREKSYEFISKRASDEPWCDALYKHSSSDYADLERLKLFSVASEDRCSMFGSSAGGYVRALVPPPPADEADAPTTSASSASASVPAAGSDQLKGHHEGDAPKRQRKKSQRDSFSDNTSSPKPRENSISEDDGDPRKRPKNKSATGTGKRTRNMSSSSTTENT